MIPNPLYLKYYNNFIKTENVPLIKIIEPSYNWTPEFTIAIPTYKRTDLLKEAIDSSVNQINYSDYDIIVVDNNPERDCSTETLLKSYRNPKISYYKNSENLGMSGNWNRLFSIAKGNYVVMLHDDDLLMPTFLKECNQIIQKLKKVSILKPETHVSYGSEINFKHSPNNIRKNLVRKIYDFSFYNNNVLGSPSGCIYKKSTVLELGGFNQDFYPFMDLVFSVFCSQHFPVFYYYKQLSIYRISENDSLNLSTLQKSLEGVYYLRRELFQKYLIPKSLIDNFLACNLTVSLKSYKVLNRNFNYNIGSLGIKPPNKIKLFFYLLITKTLNFIIQITTNMKI